MLENYLRQTQAFLKNVQTDSNQEKKKKDNKKRKELFRNYTFEVNSSENTLDDLFDKKIILSVSLPMMV